MKRSALFNLIGFALGLVLLAGGLYLIYPPAALVTSGLILMAISLFGGGQKK